MRPVALVLFTTALQWYLGYLPSIEEFVTFPGLAMALVPPAGAFLLYVLVAVIRAPVELDSSKATAFTTSENGYRTQIANLEQEIAELKLAQEQAKHSVSPSDQMRLNKCEACLCEYDEQEKDVLRHILIHGDLDERRLPDLGLPGETIMNALRKGHQHHLIRETTRQGTKFYELNPMMRSALEQLLRDPPA